MSPSKTIFLPSRFPIYVSLMMIGTLSIIIRYWRGNPQIAPPVGFLSRPARYAGPMGEQGIPSRPGDPAGEDAGGAVRQEERRRVLPVLATALSVLAVVLLLPARGESSSLSAKSAAEESGKMAVKRAVPGKGVMPGLKAATDKGLVQPLSEIRHAAAEENVRAARHPVAGHMLEQVEKKEEKPVGLPDKNPDKILVKMYMEVR